MNKASDAARLADDFVLVHPHPAKNFYEKPQMTKTNQEQWKSQKFNPQSVKSQSSPQCNNFSNVNSVSNFARRPIFGQNYKDGQNMKPVCAHCKREGHTKINCWSLNKRQDKPRPGSVATCVILNEENTVKPRSNYDYETECLYNEKSESQNSRNQNKCFNLPPETQS